MLWPFFLGQRQKFQGEDRSANFHLSDGAECFGYGGLQWRTSQEVRRIAYIRAQFMFVHVLISNTKH